MAIIGIKFWADSERYYSQDNNVVETILRKTGANRKLETCGPTSAVILLDGLGHTVRAESPGGWGIQPEDLLACWFNDVRNYKTMRARRKDIDPADYMGNEVPQYYVDAIQEVFGDHIKAVYSDGLSVMIIRKHLEAGQGVMVCLQRPGHYIAVKAYDDETNEFIYSDPWPGNGWPYGLRNAAGHNRRVKDSDLISNAKNFRVWIE